KRTTSTRQHQPRRHPSCPRRHRHKLRAAKHNGRTMAPVEATSKRSELSLLLLRELDYRGTPRYASCVAEYHAPTCPNRPPGMRALSTSSAPSAIGPNLSAPSPHAPGIVPMPSPNAVEDYGDVHVAELPCVDALLRVVFKRR